MKWGRKKSPGLSPLPQIFPISWLSMLKQKSTTSRTNSQPLKPKQNNKAESPKSSPSIPVCFRPSRLSDSSGVGGGFNSCSVPETQERSSQNLNASVVVREDDFWKFSFEKHGNGSKDGRDCLEDEEIEFQFSSHDDDDSGRSRTSRKQRKYTTPNSRKSNQKITKESAVSSNSKQNLEVSEDKERQGRVAKSPCRNRDLHVRKMKHRRKAGERSPRQGLRMEMCKVRAVEDIKKAEKKRRKRREKQRGRAFESFAVVKSSFNPHQDFRESMIEMICTNRIEGEEEMENLLACYLSLNSNEHHDIIVKVFRQVWFDLIQDSSDSEFEQGISYH